MLRFGTLQWTVDFDALTHVSVKNRHADTLVPLCILHCCCNETQRSRKTILKTICVWIYSSKKKKQKKNPAYMWLCSCAALKRLIRVS